MKTKKIILLLLSSLFLFTTLSACAKKRVDEEVVEFNNVFTIKDEDGNILLTNMVRSASPGIRTNDTEKTTTYLVEIRFSDEGAKAFAALTKEQIGKNISFYMNDELLCSVPVKEEITGGSYEIPDLSSSKEAEDLAYKFATLTRD